MTKTLLLTFSCLLTIWTFSQDSSIVDFCDKQPEYEGGEKALIRFIHENLNYPESAISSSIEGVVYVQFVVYKDGNIGNVRVIKGLHSAINEEAARLAELMPAWKPGELKGKKVNVRYTMPIRFFFHREKRIEETTAQRGEVKESEYMLMHLK